MSKLNRSNPYTLIEVLCTIFFMTIISAFVFKYYYRFDYSYRSSINNSIRMRRVMTIGERWQKILGGSTGQIPVIKNNKLIFGKEDYVAVSKKHITIHRRGKTYLLRLPDDTNAAFSIENSSTGNCLIILNLNWKYSRSPGKKTPGKAHSVRIVSALKIKHGDNS